MNSAAYSQLRIEQLPHEGVTIIEGTRYSNELLILLGQNGFASGPFVICSREDGSVTMRTISHWPEAWQPIETAPKSETPIIVGFDSASVWIVHAAWWRDGDALQAIGLDFTADDTGWWSYVHSSVTQEHLDGHRTPTHWLPMPDLPQ